MFHFVSRPRNTGPLRTKIPQLWHILLFFCVPCTTFFFLLAHSYFLQPEWRRTTITDPSSQPVGARFLALRSLRYSLLQPAGGSQRDAAMRDPGKDGGWNKASSPLNNETQLLRFSYYDARDSAAQRALSQKDYPQVPLQKSSPSEAADRERNDVDFSVETRADLQGSGSAVQAGLSRKDDAEIATVGRSDVALDVSTDLPSHGLTILADKPVSNRTLNATGSQSLREEETNPKLRDALQPPLPLAMPLDRPDERGNNSERVGRVVKNLQDIPPDVHLSPYEGYFNVSARMSGSATPLSVPNTLLDCGSRCCPESNAPFLLIVVPSVDDHENERNAIRSTWAGPVYANRSWRRLGTRDGSGRETAGEGDEELGQLVKVVFFIGVKAGRNRMRADLKEELELFGDIVVADFTDSYRNLSLKMVTALNWTATRCPRAGHVMKVDEDTFVDLALTVGVLHALSSRRPPLTRYVLGHRHTHIKPPVLRRGRWLVENQVYPFRAFPRYLVGHSYVISGDAVRDLAWAARWMPLVPNEDALLTGILTKAAGVGRVHCPSFAHAKIHPDACELIDGLVISSTGFKPTRKLFNIWRRIQQGRDACPDPKL